MSQFKTIINCKIKLLVNNSKTKKKNDPEILNSLKDNVVNSTNDLYSNYKKSVEVSNVFIEDAFRAGKTIKAHSQKITIILESDNSFKEQIYIAEEYFAKYNGELINQSSWQSDDTTIDQNSSIEVTDSIISYRAGRVEIMLRDSNVNSDELAVDRFCDYFIDFKNDISEIAKGIANSRWFDYNLYKRLGEEAREKVIKTCFNEKIWPEYYK